MSKEIQRRGGTTAQHSTVIGAPREITIDTTKNTVVVHDGVTLGGHPLAKEADAYSHPTSDGNIHLPENSTDNEDKVPIATDTAGGWTLGYIRDALMTGLSLLTSTAVEATDSIVIAVGKLQTQITNIFKGNTISIGDGADTDKAIHADTGAVNKPALRYNTTSDKWEYSNDGITYSEMGTGTGGGGTAVESVGVPLYFPSISDNCKSHVVQFAADKTTTTIKTVVDNCLSTNIWVLRWRSSDNTWIKIADYNVTGDTSTTIPSVTFAIGDKLYGKINGACNNIQGLTIEAV